MIRILFFVSGLPTGGAEMRLLSLLASMDHQRFQSGVVCLLDEGDIGQNIMDLGIPLYTLRLNRGIAGLQQVSSIIDDFQPDLVQGWMYHANLLALLGTRWAGQPCPVLFGIRNALSDWQNEKWTTRAVIRLNALLSRFARQVVFPSTASAEQHRAIGFARGNVTVIPNGFDCLHFFPDDADRQAFRQTLGISDNTILIGLVARYHPVKDHAGFLEAAALVLRNHPQVQFLLCGSGVNRENHGLAALIDQQKLADRVHLLGTRSDMNRIYRALDVLALSSKSEAAPGVLAEAMASGTPCVATDVGACAEIIGDKGWLAEPRNPESLAKALGKAIEAGAERRAELGRQARVRILEQYDLGAMIKQYESLYLLG